jgi:hypothetical protein
MAETKRLVSPKLTDYTLPVYLRNFKRNSVHREEKTMRKIAIILVLLQLIGCTQQPAINTNTNEKKINELKARIEKTEGENAATATAVKRLEARLDTIDPSWSHAMLEWGG